MTPELYGAIRAILRENGVKTLQGPSCENIPTKAEHEEGRWRIMAPLRNENCMETREGGAGKQLLPAFLPSFTPVRRAKELRSEERKRHTFSAKSFEFLVKSRQ